MSRRCAVTNKAVMSGNNVSHANNKTRRKFLPNITETRVFSETLKSFFKVKVSAAGLRSMEHMGGFDAWLLKTPASKLDATYRKIRARIVAAKSAE